MRFTKVVFLGYFPLTAVVYKDYYFEVLLKNNIEVEYLDLTNLFFTRVVNTDDFQFANTLFLKSYKEVKGYLDLQDNKQTLYISFMTFEWRIVKLFRLFTKYQLILGAFGRGVFPNVYTSVASKYLFNLKSLNFKRLKVLIQNRLAKYSKVVNYIKPYDYIFKAGEYGHFSIGYGFNIDILKATVIDINTVDYDMYLIAKRNQENFKNEHIVFLDQYIPYHPDTIYFNIKNVEPDLYYSKLNIFFDKFEKHTGKKIVIAAHPKAALYKKMNPFNGRPIFFNRASDLVREASIVMTHHSTAISLPICYNKKAILLTNKDLEDTFIDFKIVLNAIKNASGITILSMDDETINITQDIDYNIYDDYKYKYLASKSSKDKITEEVLLDFISNVN